jgi:signal transduction histidine kinase
VIIPPIPNNESERLAELYRLNILDTPDEEEFDEIVQLAAALSDSPASFITLIDKDRQWFKAKVGSVVAETEREVSFCAHCILQDEAMIVEDVAKDPRLSENPYAVGPEGIKFYAGFPLITSAGMTIGTLCITDNKTKQLSDNQIKTLKLLSKQVVKLFELRQKNQDLERMTQLNKTIISAISHDYRSPLTSIKSLLKIFESKLITAEELKKWIPKLTESLDKSLELSSDLIKWSYARIKAKSVKLGNVSLREISDIVIFENKALFSDKKNSVKVLIPEQLIVFGDKDYLKIIFRNLLLNANKFTSEGTITITTRKEGRFIKCTVSDTGIGMDSVVVDKLLNFKSTKSGTGTAGEEGSGVGLILCKDLIESIGGKIYIESEQNIGTSVHFTIINHII